VLRSSQERLKRIKEKSWWLNLDLSR
jgi:hypothetical protein